MKYSFATALLAAAKKLLNRVLQVLEGEAQQANSEADVAPIFLEGGCHVERSGESADHFGVNPKGSR